MFKSLYAEDLFFLLGTLSCLLPLVAGIIKFRLLDSAVHFLLIFFLFRFLFELVVLFLSTLEIKTVITLHFYNPVYLMGYLGFWFLSDIGKSFLNNSIIIVIIVFTTLSLANPVFFSSFNEYPYIFQLILELCIMIFTLIFFYYFPDSKLSEVYYKWFFASFFLSSSFFLFFPIMLEELVAKNEIEGAYLLANTTMLGKIMSNILLFIGINSIKP